MKTGGFLKRNSRMKKFRKVEGENKEVLQVGEADALFSKQIRHRDKQCVNCGSTMFLGCSHYFSRGTYATRYDPENCVTFCQSCHEKMELEKNGEYKKFMAMRLGSIRFNALIYRAMNKVSPYYAISEFQKRCEALEGNDIEY